MTDKIVVPTNKQYCTQTVNIVAYFHHMKTMGAAFTNIVRKYIYRVNQYADVSSANRTVGETDMSYGSNFCHSHAVVAESVTGLVTDWTTNVRFPTGT
jgi:hypothetical protein